MHEILHNKPISMAELEQLVLHNGEEEDEDGEKSTEKEKVELTVDDIIEEYVGSFGFSQLIQVFLVSLAWMLDSQSTLVTIFTDSQPSWRCKPFSSSSSCSENMALCDLDPATWEWVGGKESSTITEWNLVCDHKFRAGIPASLFFLGSLLGSAFHGRLADAYLGRKKTILLSCLITSITTFLTSFSPNIWVYALARFACGFSRSGIGICCLVLSTEVVGRIWRAQVGQYGFFLFTLGFLSLPIITYPTRSSWRKIYLILSIFPLFYSLILPFVFESPRWLAVQGRTNEALEILNKLARRNGKKLPKNLRILNPSDTKSNQPGSTEKSLWSVNWAAKRMILVMCTGFGIGFVYYGVQLNVENLNFNIYFAVALNALMEIPAVFFGSVFISFMERRVLFSLSAFISGISCIFCIFLSRKHSGRDGEKGSNGSWVQLAAESVGFMAASMAFDLLYIYCVELFPTNVRNFAVSMLRQALMLGATIAPLLVVLGRLQPSISFLIFGGFAILSGFLSYWLPETKNAPLYETLEQQGKAEKICGFSDSEIELVK